MAITVRNVLELSALKGFRLAAGEKGLSNPVKKTGIVDYEFTEGYPIDKELAFERNSFVISSLLFAKDDEERLLSAVKSLIEYGVSALGIKTVFFKELPEMVRRVADREGFAVFLFDDAYFEDVIADLREAIQADELLGFEAERLRQLMNDDLGQMEIKRLANELHPTLRKWVRAYYCETGKNYTDWEVTRVLNSFARNFSRKQESAAFQFEEGFLFLVSAEEKDEKRLQLQFSDALHYAGLNRAELITGESGIHIGEETLHLAIREAVCAQRGARLRETDFASLGDIGLLRILLWRKDSEVRESFAKEYLAPIREQEAEGGADFYRTAVCFVKSDGSIGETAKKLFVHDNTVRYRIARIREKLDPEAGEYVFFQNLASAVWIMLALEEGLI